MTKQSSRQFPEHAGGADDAASPSQPSKAAAPMEQVTYLAGEVIGDRYRLVREVGRGGMGVVWVAHSLVLGVDVALKLIRASGTGGGTTSRMAREAHAAARLGHPALVRVFDFGWTSRGDPFLVMELVQGETLSALLEREKRIPAIRAVQMLLPIADGLRLAHGKSIVHRDIKPDNIFLAKDALGRTQPKLIDFGIAKVGAQTYDGRLTQVGAVLGSPEYMSPEQALGIDDVDERTDVWSLSIVLYELVTGTIPFKKPNYNALMRTIINEPPKAMTEYGVGDESLWHIVERGLAKSREERWPNITELGEALALWLYEHGIKEDLSGNSIRAVWLDSVLSGVRVDGVPSGAPAVSDKLLSSATRGRLGTTDAESPRVREILLQRLPSGRPPKRSMAVALALGVGLGAGGLTAAAAFGTRDRAVSPAESAKSARIAPAAERKTSERFDLDREPDAASAPSRESGAGPNSPSGAPTSSKAEATTTRPSFPKPAARPAIRTPRRSHDFGF
jgi:serine/threonine-protein kinase